ncbi:CBS domain-containing protein [Haloferax sp. Atlit-10N]|uniref:Zinc metalloprotease n=1 Tax=Haloferax prahovense (strain DSM 18310 / JCM 13924 / TL6) TaxID=1227461 RepID=M0GQY1_HALPT|nr:MULTISPECIES: M50 family metallopeptidase [Haloferax]ELZ73963.1 metalloprotease [Haloferax prahovense DSM 18310]RDZ42972.1 CBS domain-containing protein [Haloferax sp. Atlit-19N]RDZ46101.1 CBS domain-containing protein [Haloferax sp. Atlit-16N]RDZ59934.1 CBS domain-containing protein [Haloferax sp. Atlit-10N]
MRGIRIGSAFGIPIKLDLTFLIVLPLFAWLIGSDVTNLALVVNDLFGSNIDGVAISAGSMQWILGSAAAIGLFAGVLLHEFGHSLVAMRYGYEIESITLWLFGGVARFKEIPEDWKQEFTIAVAGPLVSVAIGVVSYAGFLLLPESQAPAQFVLGYLALVNVSLAVFNMLPGFPMDGGRVLRALLARNRPHAKATQMAAEVGKVFAFLLGLFGLFFNLFLVALAFFIYMGASGEAQQTVLKATFQDVVVRDIMTSRENLDVVDERTSVAELLERMFVERHTGYPVLRNGNLVGMVTLDDARGVKEVERDAFRVDDIMSDELTTITPDADAMDAIALMQERGVGRLPVVDETGDLVGLVSRSDLVTAFNIIRSRGSLDAMPRSDAGLAQLR